MRIYDWIENISKLFSVGCSFTEALLWNIWRNIFEIILYKMKLLSRKKILEKGKTYW
jgi:hypothetical protein